MILCHEGRKAALFTSRGILYQNGQDAHAISDVIKTSDWFKRAITEINLINGKIIDKKYVRKLIKQTPEQFKQFWSNITARQIDGWDVCETYEMNRLFEVEGVSENLKNDELKVNVTLLSEKEKVTFVPRQIFFPHGIGSYKK